MREAAPKAAGAELGHAARRGGLVAERQQRRLAVRVDAGDAVPYRARAIDAIGAGGVRSSGELRSDRQW